MVFILRLGEKGGCHMTPASVSRFRLSYLPPLMVYVAAGMWSLTSVVGAFFAKDYLDSPAAFFAALTFWAGIPWALKMPVGHVVDLIWRWKAVLVYVGAALITVSMLIMIGCVSR